MKSEPQPIGVLCCHGLQVEVEETLRRLQRRDITIETFPTLCYQSRVSTTDPIAAMHRLLERAEQFVAICMNCCWGKLDTPHARERMVAIRLETQGEAFLGADATIRALDEGCFITHRGWLEQWRSTIEVEWGFDRDTARAFYAQSSRKILLLDTGIVPIEVDRVEELSEFLALPVETRFVGISHLEALLAGAIAELEAKAERQRCHQELMSVRASAAGYAAVVDFVSSLGRVPSEQEVLQTLHDLAQALFGASEVTYDTGPVVIEDLESQAEDGFTVAVEHAGEMLGCLRVSGLAVPEHRDRYHSLARALADASATAIRAARLLDSERRLSEALESKVQELDAFASVTAHDLKQPLQAAFGFADLLRITAAESLTKQQQGFVGEILTALKRMSQLIEEILTLTRVGRKDVPTETVDLHELVERLIHELGPTLEERGCQLSCKSLPKVRGVRRWVHEILRNLLTNAIKYNDKPEPLIEIGVAEPSEHDSSEMVVLYVRDNGAGIAPEDQTRVFDMFHRVERNGNAEGTGIGLSIVKKAVEGEGGRVWVESLPGFGSTFYFSLPVPTA